MSKKQTPNRQAKHVEDVLLRSSRTALSLMRALNYEIEDEGSEDVIAFRLAGILGPLAQIARSSGYVSESRQIESAAEAIDKDISKRHGLKPNARRPTSDEGLADQPVLLQSYCERAAESAEMTRPQDAEPNEAVFEEARAYDKALKSALEELVEKFPPMDDATADDLWQAQAPYLVLMTLRGEGVGIWDGDWDHFYEDTDEASEFLKKKLGKFADDTGAGSLEEAFLEAAEESCGDGDDDDDQDDEDDEEDEED